MFSKDSYAQADAFVPAHLLHDIAPNIIGPLPVLYTATSSTSSALPVQDGGLEAAIATPIPSSSAISPSPFTNESDIFPQQGLSPSTTLAQWTVDADNSRFYSSQGPQLLSSQDPLTGVASRAALINHPASLSDSSNTDDFALQSLQNSAPYSAISGYGLVNANTAVAWAMGDTALPQQIDFGGVNIGNDMVNAPDAWLQGITGQDVIVAVIDSGVDIAHPDLDDNIWVNSDEIFGDGIDNDLNGYVDDTVGWNFGGNNASIWDYNGHGTHVVGTIAAEANGFGITGVAPNAKIMPIKIGDVGLDNRFVNPGNLAQAIRYAVDNGADVINMSLSWTPSYELLDAFAYAASQNVITVTASGNDGMATPSMPASFSTRYGLTVGAVDYNANMAYFSNWAGQDTRMGYVAAPGVNIYSTQPTNVDWDGYGFSNGTSMAAPHVAGVVALMFSANPDLTHDQVRSITTASATYLGNPYLLSQPPSLFGTTGAWG